MGTDFDRAWLYLVDLRRRVRGSPRACGLVDRCLRLLAQAQDADAPTAARLEAEIEALRGELHRRLGPARRPKVH